MPLRKLTYDEILSRRLGVEQAQSAPKHPVSVMLSNVRSLYNVGSVFRTCDAARVTELILCGFTPHPPRNEIYKTALGAVDTVAWRYEKSELDAINQLKQNGVKVLAVELAHNARSYSDLGQEDYPCCLVFGNELVGISDEVLASCDDAISIPMFGVKHSLNVAVAVGIAVFEAVKLR